MITFTMMMTTTAPRHFYNEQERGANVFQELVQLSCSFILATTIFYSKSNIAAVESYPEMVLEAPEAGGKASTLRPSCWRWLVLASFALLTFSNSWLWITWSAS